MNKRIIARGLMLLFVLSISLILNKSMVSEAVTFADLKPAKASDREGLENAINESEKAVAGSSISVVAENKKAVSKTNAYYKFVLSEDGIVYLRYSFHQLQEANHMAAGFTLYGDKNLTDIKLGEKSLEKKMSYETYVHLKKGTYYIEVVPKETEYFGEYVTCTQQVGVAVGYVPVTGKTTDYKFVLSETKTTTDNIKVTVNTADPDAIVWVTQGEVNSSLLGNQFEWIESRKIPDKTFTVTKNGLYTIQVKDSLGNYTMGTLKISNIDKTKPTTPELTTYKVNTTKISGTAEAGTVIYIKIGSKTKTEIARSDNTFTHKVAKLEKGTKITVYAVDNAGNKSNSKTFTVK